MKIVLTGIFIIVSSLVFSQELSVGGFVATNLKIKTSSEILGFGASIEYRPKKSVVSINSDILFFYVNNGPIATFPLYIKIIIGNKLRVCPEFGGFIRTNENYGYLAGISVDYKIRKRLLLYLKADYMRDYWKDKYIRWDRYNYVGGKRINSKTGVTNQCQG